MYIFIGIFIILLIITILYFRYKNQFWRIQPVFHIFDLSYYFCKPYVILEELPKTNKFCNFQNIETKTKLTSDDTVQFTKIIQDYFIQNKYLPDNKFLPKSENILPYFSPVDQKNPNFFSFYKESHMTNDLTTGKVTESSKIIAVMTSRPITVSLNSNIEPLIVYYVDYLCVDPNYRKKGIAPQMIQTHEFKQRHENHNIKISLFKREGTLTGIVPLTVYKTSSFDMQKWLEPALLLPIVSLLECTKTNFHFILDYLKEHQQNKTFELIEEPENLKDILCYLLLQKE